MAGAWGGILLAVQSGVSGVGEGWAYCVVVGPASPPVGNSLLCPFLSLPFLPLHILLWFSCTRWEVWPVPGLTLWLCKVVPEPLGAQFWLTKHRGHLIQIEMMWLGGYTEVEGLEGGE